MDRLEDQLPLTRETKASVVAEYATKEGDTGSPEVQIALLTERIAGLTDLYPHVVTAATFDEHAAALADVEAAYTEAAREQGFLQ